MRHVVLPRRPFFQVLTSFLVLEKREMRQKKRPATLNIRSTFGADRRMDGFALAQFVEGLFIVKSRFFYYSKA